MQESFFLRSVDDGASAGRELAVAQHGPATGPLPLALSADHDWALEFRRCPSPNADERPERTDISLLVVHNISLPSGHFGPRADGSRAIEELFCNRLGERPLADPARAYFGAAAIPQVSAHICLYRDGDAAQFVAFSRRAWHAGQSWFAGRQRCNDFSIGVELEGDDHSGYTDVQYRLLARLASALMRHYPALTPARIVGHADIAPLRKTDPGPSFDWQRLRFELEYPR